KDRRVLTDDAHEIVRRVRVVLLARPLVVRGAEPGLEQQPVGDWRRPSARLHALRAELALAIRFRRCIRDRRTAERSRARALAADVLLVPREGDLVAVARLPRDARRVVLPGAVVERRPAEIRHVEPRARVPRVLVVEGVEDVLPRSLHATAH